MTGGYAGRTPKLLESTTPLSCIGSKSILLLIPRRRPLRTDCSYTYALAHGPSPNLVTYQAYDINGYTFYTEEHDEKTSYQNSSIRIECMTVDEADKRVYYGTIKEIWELDYVKVKVALFRCTWIPLGHVKVDDYRKTCVNRTTMAYHADPFILASDATQIFFVEDPCIRTTI